MVTSSRVPQGPSPRLAHRHGVTVRDQVDGLSPTVRSDQRPGLVPGSRHRGCRGGPKVGVWVGCANGVCGEQSAKNARMGPWGLRINSTSTVLAAYVMVKWRSISCNGRRRLLPGDRIVWGMRGGIRPGPGCGTLHCSAKERRRANKITRIGRSSEHGRRILRIPGQCAACGAGVPSDHLPTQTIIIVARSSGSSAAITGEPGRSAPQLFAALPATKNIR